jgi:hypothetical protein
MFRWIRLYRCRYSECPAYVEVLKLLLDRRPVVAAQAAIACGKHKPSYEIDVWRSLRACPWVPDAPIALIDEAKYRTRHQA